MVNEKQELAIKGIADYKVIVAGPGTGKTRTLVNMIANDIKNGYDPSEIVAMTFTRNSAAELKERLQAKIGEDDALKVTANTIHAFCLSIITNAIGYTDYEEDFNIYDQDDRKDIINYILKTTKKDRLTKYADIEHYVKTGEAKTLWEPIVYDEYLERMYSYNAMDLSMIIPYTTQLLQDEPDVKATVSSWYKHFYIDEFQDTNDTQLDFIKEFSPDTLVVIGDPDQSIYQWNGARPENMVNIEEIFPSIEIYYLERNYRSTIGIVEAANDLIVNNETRMDKNLITDKSGPPVHFIPASSESQEIDAIVRELHPKLEANAVICRTNARALMVYEGLLERGIECNLVSSHGDVFRTQSIKNIIRILSLLLNPCDDYNAERVGLWLLELSGTVMRRIRADAVTQNNSLLVQISKDTDVGKKFYTKLMGIQDTMDIDTAYHLITQLLMTLGVYNRYVGQGRTTRMIEIEEFRKQILKWESTQMYFGSSKHIKSFMKYVKLRDIQESLKKNEPVVNVMTVHGAKGLEFKKVFIPGCNEYEYPIVRKGVDNIEEERRIMYVAITRAAEELVFTRAVTKKGRDYRLLGTKESRFLKEVF